METNNEINLKNEALIMVNLSACLEILTSVTESKFSKGTPYLLEALFIRLRHLTSYFTRGNSPLIHHKKEFDKQELSIINNIVGIRMASAHPESDQHWLNEHFMINGGMNFKDNDVQIQYGSNKLFLVREVIFVYKKMRGVFAKMPELPRLAKHPAWELDEQRLNNVEQILKDLLRNPEKLLRK